jgi:hypothetical protein
MRAMKLLLATVALLLCSCAIVTMSQERRLAPADLTYSVGKVLVIPFAMTDELCKDDLDKGARKDATLRDAIASAAGKSLQAHQYATVASTLTDDQLKVIRKSLNVALCNQRPLVLLAPDVMALLDAEMAKQGADAALVGGVSSLRWHLKMSSDGAEAGVSSDKLSEFRVGAEAALYDARTHRVVWSEVVDSSQFLSSYAAAVAIAFDFDTLKVTDPHQKLFYDFPLPAGAAAPAQAAR